MSLNPIQTALQTIASQLQGDLLGSIKTPLTNFFTNIKANPDPQNVAAQAALFQVTVMLSGPSLEKTAISQAADAGLNLVALIPDAPAS